MLERIHVIVEHGVRMALASSDDEAAGPPPDAKYVFELLCLCLLIASTDNRRSLPGSARAGRFFATPFRVFARR
jgi:hypothetical protein